MISNLKKIEEPDPAGWKFRVAPPNSPKRRPFGNSWFFAEGDARIAIITLLSILSSHHSHHNYHNQIGWICCLDGGLVVLVGDHRHRLTGIFTEHAVHVCMSCLPSQIRYRVSIYYSVSTVRSSRPQVMCGFSMSIPESPSQPVQTCSSLRYR
jgi:hypothetical protein